MGRVGFGIVALGLAFGASCSAKSNEAATPAVPAEQRIVQVEVVAVAAQQAGGQLRASGVVVFKNETALSFSAPGQIETLGVDQGDRVAPGQVLATLRRTSVGADPAEAELVRRTAQQTFDRVSRLFAAGAASQAEVDNARLALERSREIVSLVAPAGGIVLRRDAVRGQVVAAGQAVLQIGEARTGVVVRAALSSTDVERVKLGDRVAVDIRGRPQRVGEVSQISPKMTQGMAAFDVEVRLEDGDGLRSGEIAEVLIATADPAASGPTIFYIPAISLIDARADQAMVYVVGADMTARRRAVRTEGVSDKGVAVAEGLVAGEQVVTRGASMVRDGDRVAVNRS